MQHHTPLIAVIVAGLGFAFLLGVVAQRLRLSPLVGYLVAGVLIGPFTPGYVADQALALELAEIGVILLMFGVGLHFSLKDLLSVKAIAVPGAVGQIALATLMGMALAWAMGWPVGGGLVFGLALSVASTVVLLRALQERRLIDSERGRIAVGWLIVEDLAMVLALVLLPGVAGLMGGEAGGGGASTLFGLVAAQSVWQALGFTLVKVAAFATLMLVVGRRLIPLLLHYVAHTGSRELFRLAVLAVALGVAFGAATLFDVSFALGAFLAGMVLAESPLSHRAAEETLPLRDAFAVLFFVSVGMLFDPGILVRQPGPVLATLFIIVLGKSLVALAIVRAFGYPLRTALTISASLAQIGEFSFILAGLGVELKLMPGVGRDLILAGAILSILVNPLFFLAVDRFSARLRQPAGATTPAKPEPAEAEQIRPTTLTGHAVLVGYGRVGRLVGEGLRAAGQAILVIEEKQFIVEEIAKPLRDEGSEAMAGNAADPALLAAANLAGARWFISAVPNPFEAGNLIEAARQANPGIEIIARAHSDAEVEHLTKFGANLVIMGEREIANAILGHVLGKPGPGPDVAAANAPAPAPATAAPDLPADLPGGKPAGP